MALGTAKLTASSASPRADAALLLAHVLRRSREWLVAHADASLSSGEAALFNRLCADRRAGVPVAYLLGSAYFYGREFIVNEHVLVPRPETEHLVEEAIEFVRRSARVLDVGTGCGAIACTLAAETGAMVDATDRSRAALDIAEKNARRLGVLDRIAFYHGDLAEPVKGNRYELVMANLPYIPTNDLPQPPDPASFEPRCALDGGTDGLSVYRELMPALAGSISEEGMILLEAAPPTLQRLADMLHTTLPNFAISVGDDYSGLARYVRAIGKRSAANAYRSRDV